MSTDQPTLTEFLLARIAEDEAVAREAIDCGPEWVHEAMRYGANPARVLAECEAKRRIVEYRYSWNLEAERMSEPPFGPIFEAKVSAADAVLRALALPYADHPDYDEVWRP